MKKGSIKKLIVLLFIGIILVGIPSSTMFSSYEYIDDGDTPMGVYCSAKDAGMFPNNKKKAKENGNIFIQTLNKYAGIVIDDAYYVGTPTEELTTREVEIIGSGDSTLIAAENTSTILFYPEDISNLIITNVNFINNNKDRNFLIVYDPAITDAKVENVVVENCTFKGNISLYRQYGDTTLDPDVTDYGIDSLTFCNNKVFDTGLSFIVLIDVPVTTCKISNNVIKNFNYTFLKIAITNEIPYEKKMYNHIEYLEVDMNTVTCEDDWWGKTSLGTYYTFVLYEGTKVLYNNNYIEGMKALEDIALYDAYLSAHIVNYTNNVWKNNICFASDKTNNTLLKAKGGGERPLIRNYSNNTFIIEEGFAERVGQAKENLHVDFISLQQYTESYRIDNNVFDIYDIRFPKSSLMIGNYVFINNTIRASKVSGKLAIVRLKDDYLTGRIEIANNDIEFTEKTDESFTLVCVIDYREKSSEAIDNVIVKDNKITAPFGYLFYGLDANKFEFKNNRITDISENNSRLAYDGELVNSEVENNIIVNKNSLILYEGNSYAEIEKKANSY